jgi:pSer/pThr/pTyr-binding forkhead associated (FHA) protein
MIGEIGVSRPQGLFDSYLKKKLPFPPGKNIIRVGRNRDNDFVIPDDSDRSALVKRDPVLHDNVLGVSRFHAVINNSPAGYFINDFKSTCGTFLNGRKVGAEPVPLKRGDEIVLGPGYHLEVY